MSHRPLLDVPALRGEPEDREYRSMLERLYALARSGTKFGLDRIRRVLAGLGHPEAMPCVHVAGSNGKGSTCAFLAGILAERGLRVGLFTSPHLISLTERVQFIDRNHWREIEPAELVDAVRRVESVAPGFDGLSFFEVVTAAGLVALKQQAVDVAVVEAGLGARLDATRLVDAQVAVLTDLSLEHTDILGETIEEIAREEGAVVRPGRPLIMADGPETAMDEVERMAEAVQAPVFRLGRDFHMQRGNEGWGFRSELGELRGLHLSLRGEHQSRNGALAVQAAFHFLGRLAPDEVRAGLAKARWPGRLEHRQVRGVDLWLDGAQNPHAARALAEALGSEGLQPMHVVFGVLSDKDVGAMLDSLLPWAASLVLTRPSSVRARAPESLLGRVQGNCPVSVSDSVVDALQSALEQATRDGRGVLVCGSLYLVGDVRSILRGS